MDRSNNRRVIVNLDFTGEGRVDDPYGHGTHVASIAGGNGRVANGQYSGIAPNANLINLRVLGATGYGSESAVLAALDWVMTNHISYNIRVEGHTDNVPIHTAQFPSNWELSTARATFLLQYLISTTQIPAPRLSAVGYGEYRPVASNDTSEGRASNRRVDLVVLGDEAEKLEPKVR